MLSIGKKKKKTQLSFYIYTATPVLPLNKEALFYRSYFFALTERVYQPAQDVKQRMIRRESIKWYYRRHKSKRTFLCRTLIFLSLISMWSRSSCISWDSLFLSCEADMVCWVFFSIILFFSSKRCRSSSTWTRSRNVIILKQYFIPVYICI